MHGPKTNDRHSHLTWLLSAIAILLVLNLISLNGGTATAQDAGERDLEYSDAGASRAVAGATRDVANATRAVASANQEIATAIRELARAVGDIEIPDAQGARGQGTQTGDGQEEPIMVGPDTQLDYEGGFELN